MIKDMSPTRRFALTALVFVLAEAVLMAFIDRPLSEYLFAIDKQYPPAIDFFRAWTDLGKSCWYLWPSGIGAIVCFALAEWRQIPTARREVLRLTAWKFGFFFICVAASGLVTDIIKRLAGRARPVLLAKDGFYGIVPFNFRAVYQSFPSGHTTTAFAVAFALIALYPRGRKWLLAFAAAIGLSRIMVNAHYLSDVLAGSVVGMLTVAKMQDLFRRRDWGARKHGIFPIDIRPPRR